MKQLRICSWNINLGLDLDKTLKALGGPADFRLTDCIALQETSLHNGEDAKHIAKQLGKDFEYRQIQVQTPNFKWYSTKRKIKGMSQGNAFIWNKKRLKVTKIEPLILPPYDTRKLSIYGKAVYKISSTRQRMCLLVEGVFQKQLFRLYVVHFDVIGPISKAKQFEFVLEDANQHTPVDLEIIAGDLNTFRFLRRPSWNKLQKLAQKYYFIELTSNITWTFADKKIPFKHKLDAIYLRHKLSLQYNSWALDIPGSDHLPVFANIELP